jgi:hypothetical protein
LDAPRIHAGHHIQPLMLMTTSVGMAVIPASPAARAVSTSRATAGAETFPLSGRKSSARVKKRTTSKPRSAIRAMSSRTSAAS